MEHHAMTSPLALPNVDGEHEPRHRTPPAHLADAEDFVDDRRLRWTTLEDQKIVEAVRRVRCGAS